LAKKQAQKIKKSFGGNTMNIRNKKLINALVATFMVVLIAGAAFAFASRGPLVFDGVANINAELRVDIVEGFIQTSGTGVNFPQPTGAVITDPDNNDAVLVNVGVTNGEWVEFPTPLREVGFEINFHRPTPNTTFAFIIENTGTMPARIFDYDIITAVHNMDLPPDFPLEDWQEAFYSAITWVWSYNHEGGGGETFPLPPTYEPGFGDRFDPFVLEVGEQAIIGAHIRFLWADGNAIAVPDLYFMDASFLSKLDLQYEMYR